MNKNRFFPALVTLTMALSACGEKDATSDVPKIEAGENIPAPDGQQWSDIVAVSQAGGYVMGNPDATLKITEYGSYTCSHCGDFAETSAEDIDSMIDTGKMSFEFRPYVRDPLDMTVALLAGCAGTEPYFPLSHQLFANQRTMFETAQGAGEETYGAAMEKPVNERFFALAQMAGLIDFVKQRGISEEKAKQCLSDETQIEALTVQVQEANNQYNITGTPTILINGKVAENMASWAPLKAKLKEAGL